MARIRQRLAQAINQTQDQMGLGLVETLVAVAILGTAVVAFVVALSAGSIAVAEQDEAVVAQSLAQTQLEYTKSYPYDPEATTYPAVDTPEGYTVSVGVTSIPDTDADIQKITVTVSRESESLITVEDYHAISFGVTSIPDTDADIQKITVTVSRESENLITVEDYKVNR